MTDNTKNFLNNQNSIQEAFIRISQFFFFGGGIVLVVCSKWKNMQWCGCLSNGITVEMAV